MRALRLCLGALLAAVSSASALAADEPTTSPIPRTVYWGDTHLHTRNSADAYSLGNQNLTPADAYRFARGETVLDHQGQPVALRRPLDFLIVSDHAEYLAGYYGFTVGDPRVRNSAIGARWADDVASGNAAAMMGSFVGSIDDPENNPAFPEPIRRSIWRQVVQTADEYN
ncbi:MAG: DUF3604 domain-containing protein, partial [Pseudomonadota bacterium]